MKKFAKVLFTVLICAGIFSTVIYSSCSNKCGTTTCQNGGTCTNNKCVCPTGYSGNSCQTAWDDEYIGTYNCSRSVCHPGVAGTNAWQSAITKSATNGGYTVNISNFDNSNTTQVAIIDSAGNMKITPAAGTYGVSATGNFVSNTITANFTTYVTGGSGYSCIMTMVKE